MDRDFPIGRREARILVIGLVTMTIVGIALFGGLIPGLKPNYGAPNIASLDGVQYYQQTELLHLPVFQNTSASWNVTFRGVHFELWLTNWYSLSGGLVHGIGTEPNGSSQAFVLGTTPTNSTPDPLYLSPDGLWGVWWLGGWFGGITVQLLVKV